MYVGCLYRSRTTEHLLRFEGFEHDIEGKKLADMEYVRWDRSNTWPCRWSTTPPTAAFQTLKEFCPASLGYTRRYQWLSAGIHSHRENNPSAAVYTNIRAKVKEKLVIYIAKDYPHAVISLFFVQYRSCNWYILARKSSWDFEIFSVLCFCGYDVENTT